MNFNRELNDTAMIYLENFRRILERMIEEMTGAKLCDSISYNFIIQMIPHHEAAIEMSKNILKYTDNPVLIRIAQGIIEEQTKSIANMEKILNCCREVENCDRDICEHQEKINEIMDIMFYSMENARAVNNLDCNFIWEMIPHHRGAVEMSENTLMYCICEDLKPILTAIISSQKRGIIQMQRLSRCIGC